MNKYEKQRLLGMIELRRDHLAEVNSIRQRAYIQGALDELVVFAKYCGVGVPEE